MSFTHRPPRSDLREGARGFGLGALLAVAGLVLLLLLAAMWAFGFGLFSKGTAEVRGQTGVRERTQANGAYRIAAYEHFYDLCASVQADEQTMAALREEAATATPARKAQIAATVTAVRANRAQSITQYNADARKTTTAANFKASDLPYQLDPATQETTCAA